MAQPDIYVSVDIEADGPIPADFSMVQLGASVVGQPELTFNRYLRPMTDQWDREALRRINLDRELLLSRGEDPLKVMLDFEQWVQKLSVKGRTVFAAFNAPFDWMFVHWYLIHFLHRNRFGISGKDIKAFYMGALGLELWSETRKDKILTVFKPKLPHTHDALDDALEQGELLLNIQEFNRHPALVEARKIALKDFAANKPSR